jgi:hypothetical protein
MLLPREIDIIETARHVPLRVPKPKVLQLAEADKHNKAKVDSAPDEDWPRQVGARRPSQRDCATGSGIDCGRKSAVAMVSKHLPTTSQGTAGGNGQQKREQQDGQKQKVAQKPQPGMQGRPDQQQPRTQGRDPQQKQQPQAMERHRPQHNLQPPTTESREARQKQAPQAVERRGPQQKQPPQPWSAASRSTSSNGQPPTAAGRNRSSNRELPRGVAPDSRSHINIQNINTPRT